MLEMKLSGKMLVGVDWFNFGRFMRDVRSKNTKLERYYEAKKVYERLREEGVFHAQTEFIVQNLEKDNSITLAAQFPDLTIFLEENYREADTERKEIIRKVKDTCKLKDVCGDMFLGTHYGMDAGGNIYYAHISVFPLTNKRQA